MCFNSNPIVFSRLIVVIDDHLVSVAVGHDRHTISPAMVGYNSARGVFRQFPKYPVIFLNPIRVFAVQQRIRPFESV